MASCPYHIEVAKLHCRMLTNPADLRPSRAYQALLNEIDQEPPSRSSALEAGRKALHFLDMGTHWPAIQVDTLPIVTRDHDIQLLQSLPKGASPLAPYRHVWNLEIQHQAKIVANEIHERWLMVTDHRAHTYATETLAALETPHSRSHAAPWIKLHLKPQTQQQLLEQRTMGTDLATHTPTGQRKNHDPYPESFCPLCARISHAGRTHQQKETFEHMSMDCPHLAKEQETLHNSAHQFTSQYGGLRTTKTSLPLLWSQMERRVQIACLMGNFSPTLKNTLSEPAELVTCRMAARIPRGRS